MWADRSRGALPAFEEAVTTPSGQIPHAGIAVVNYHSADDVSGLLSSLPREEGVRVTVVVVDNSESPAEVERLRVVAGSKEAAGLDVHVVDAGRNGGYAAGNNRAVAELAGFGPDVVVVANPDIRWERGSLGDLVRFSLAHPGSVVSIPTSEHGSVTSGMTRFLPLTGYFRADEPGSAHPLAYASGHCFALPASLWADLDGLTEDYFLYCEEIDLAFRLRARGGDFQTFDPVVVEHAGGGTINQGEDARSGVSFFYGTRSRVMLYRRFRRLRLFLIPFLVLRLGWAGFLAVTGKPRSGATVVRALWSGLRVPLTPGRGA